MSNCITKWKENSVVLINDKLIIEYNLDDIREEASYLGYDKISDEQARRVLQWVDMYGSMLKGVGYENIK